MFVVLNLVGVYIAGAGRGRTPCYIVAFAETPPEEGTLSKYQVYKRLGISQVEVHERVSKSVIWLFQRAFKVSEPHQVLLWPVAVIC